MTRSLPVLTVVPVLIALWYLAVIPMNMDRLRVGTDGMSMTRGDQHGY